MTAVLEELEKVEARLAELAGTLEPGALSPEAARSVLGGAAAIERRAAGLRLLVTRRALVAAPYQDEGHRSEASWLAEQTRTSVPEAVQTIVTAQRLAELPATTDAVRRGDLSPLEVRTIAAAATADPSAESDLLEAVDSLSMRGFCDYARRVATVARDGDPGHRAELVSKRFVRWWTDTEGAFRLSGGFTPEEGMEMVTAIRSRTAHMADEATLAGRHGEPQAALDADALVSIVRGEERRSTFRGPEGGLKRRTDMILHTSLEALRRGSLEDGEICEIPGVGPVPLRVAEHFMGGSILRSVITDGVDVATVTHLGRCVPAAVETALESRDRTCVVPGCEVSINLEIDHWQVPFAQGGPSELWNLCRLCRHHHRLKTFDGYQLSGGPEKWEWRPPN